MSNKRLYFSGVDRPSHLYLVASEGGAVMISPPQLAARQSILDALKSTGVASCFDSGGFQGQTDVYAYADIILQVHQFYDWYPNLDVIGDQDQSNANYEKLISLLPIDVANKLMWVYQRGDLAMLKEYASQLKYIGIGGLVPIANNYPVIKAYLDSLIPTLQEAGARVHLFGCNGSKILKWAAFQDWFASADSTRWMYGLKSSEIILKSGDKLNATELGFAFTPEERSRHNIRVLRSFVETQETSLQLDLLDVA